MSAKAGLDGSVRIPFERTVHIPQLVMALGLTAAELQSDPDGPFQLWQFDTGDGMQTIGKLTVVFRVGEVDPGDIARYKAVNIGFQGEFPRGSLAITCKHGRDLRLDTAPGELFLGHAEWSETTYHAVRSSMYDSPRVLVHVAARIATHYDETAWCLGI